MPPGGAGDASGTPLTIRAAQAADAAALAAFAARTYAAAFGASMSAADLAAHLDAHLSLAQVEHLLRHDGVLLAQSGERLIGFIQFGPVNGESQAPGLESPAQELRRLYVEPALQGRGIGTALMHRALQHPWLLDAPRIVLDVWERNTGAQRFYRRHGFEVVGRRAFEVASGTPTDADLLMQRPGAPAPVATPRLSR